MRDFKEPTAISPVLTACPISDALITWIPEDENAAVYAIIIILILLVLYFRSC